MAAVIQQDSFTAADAARYNIYSAVHKGLRGFMVETTSLLGKLDVKDDCERATVIEQVRSLLEACRVHVHHENDFVHPALERASQDSSKVTRDDHVDHMRKIESLEHRVSELETAGEAQRSFLAKSLYLELTKFVAENFEHMAYEETENHQVLIGAYSDAELLQIEGAIVASMPPGENLILLRWMLTYMNNDERVFALGGMKQAVPPEVFAGVIDLARNTLSQREFFKLERALA